MQYVLLRLIPTSLISTTCIYTLSTCTCTYYTLPHVYTPSDDESTSGVFACGRLLEALVLTSDVYLVSVSVPSPTIHWYGLQTHNMTLTIHSLMVICLYVWQWAHIIGTNDTHTHFLHVQYIPHNLHKRGVSVCIHNHYSVYVHTSL